MGEVDLQQTSRTSRVATSESSTKAVDQVRGGTYRLARRPHTQPAVFISQCMFLFLSDTPSREIRHKVLCLQGTTHPRRWPRLFVLIEGAQCNTFVCEARTVEDVSH